MADDIVACSETEIIDNAKKSFAESALKYVSSMRGTKTVDADEVAPLLLGLANMLLQTLVEITPLRAERDSLAAENVKMLDVVKAADKVKDDTELDGDGYPRLGYDGACALLSMMRALTRYHGDTDNG